LIFTRASVSRIEYAHGLFAGPASPHANPCYSWLSAVIAGKAKWKSQAN
jgi:hypothetical protein